MRRIDTSNRSPDLFGPGKHGFRDGDPLTGVPSTSLNAAWFNAMQEEVASLIEAAGLTLDPGDTTQLRKAIKLLASPAGEVTVFARATAPTGWLKANGALVSRTTYADLFAAIGTTFGAGDGSTTFALPDLRGEFLRGWDDGRGVDGGRSFGSAQADAFRSHSHDFQSYAAWIDNPGAFIVNAGGSQASLTRLYATGSTGGAETRPRNVALLACIKF